MELNKVSVGTHAAQRPTQRDERKLKEVAQEFEAILVASLLKDVQPSGHAGVFGSGVSRDLYQQLFIDEMAKTIARSGGIGLGKMLERQLRTTLNVGGQQNRLKKAYQSTDLIDSNR